MPNHHHDNPQLWFRPSPALPSAVLSSSLEKETITATLRLGKRDASHWKGYIPGSTVTLRLYDEAGLEVLSRRIRITRVLIKPLQDFTDAELALTRSTDWQSAQQELSFFERRPVAPDEPVTLVEFTYLNEEPQ